MTKFFKVVSHGNLTQDLQSIQIEPIKEAQDVGYMFYFLAMDWNTSSEEIVIYKKKKR